ncbi:MAG: hypothetical protein HZA01_05205 [Nitrospinae bacterium]|nr:hypothetical protein [Nitrospinota bacterium]
MYLDFITQNSTVTLSEPSLMEFFGGMPEFSVKKIRRLRHPNFQMVQVFISSPRMDAGLMLANRLTEGEDGDGDLAIFQEDHTGHVDQLGPEHLSPDKENFAAEFKAVYTDEGRPPFEVKYRLVRAGEFHGIRDAQKEEALLSQGIYDTQDDQNFPLAMVEWERDWLTAWFGKELRKDQAAFL